MFCTECGASLDANSKSCVACGTRVELEPVLDIKENVVTNALSPKTIVSGELSPRKKVIVISSVFIAVVIGCFILNVASTYQSNAGYHYQSNAELQRDLKEHPNPISQNDIQNKNNTVTSTETQEQNEASSSEANELRHRCIVQAVEQGYRSGDCGYSFINECVTSQSREKMQKILRLDGVEGFDTTDSCPLLQQDFVEEFKIEKAKKDKF